MHPAYLLYEAASALKLHEKEAMYTIPRLERRGIMAGTKRVTDEL
jgi:hypothetical protein